jgi:two-component system, chemotaxis family, CheB/CheR fusion protein
VKRQVKIGSGKRITRRRRIPWESSGSTFSRKASTNLSIDQSNGPHPSFPIVGIGASAGGLEAFTHVLKHLPVDTGLGFVLVQHLAPQHESALTQLLARATLIPVLEVTNNLRIEANHVYVIPPNRNLGIAKGVLKLKPRSENRGAHPIDAFFESLAQDQRERAIGVILSGTATDGTLGLEAIKAEGGITFAQDDSAKYDSMPRSAVAAGCVDFVLKPENIAKELARIAKHPYVAAGASLTPSERQRDTIASSDETPLPARGDGKPRTVARYWRADADAGREQRPSVKQSGFQKILLLLRNRCDVDFSLYKSTTIQRRITRRMVLTKHNTLEDYAQFLRGNTKELEALYADCLINVTSFFRNPEAFELLKRRVFPRLLQERGDEPLRVWVLGCSTGQEAYSIAITFQEASEKYPRARPLQVFATDLNEALLDKARHGLYTKNLAQDVSPERLRRFFIQEQGGYRVIKSLRDTVVFARQNLISDPPFSRLDLISCRNLLIYLEPSVQKKALPTFHYALKPEGFLLLGASESIGKFTDLFQPVDRKHKIYSRKPGATPGHHLPVKKERDEHPSPHSTNRGPSERPPEDFNGELNAQREADRLMVNRFAPAGVLINAEWQILQFRGPTGAWLQPPKGRAHFHVLKMAREGLMLPLRAAINKAKKEGKTVRREDVRVRQNGEARMVNLEVIPLKNLRERCFLILFHESEEFRRSEQRERRKGTFSSRSSPAAKSFPASRHSAELERELAETRDYLQSIQEQHEAASEELESSNEEVQSANEELQSINEELETTKEELESSNEELITVNEETAYRNTELSRLNSDLLNLQTSTNLGILLLGRDLVIRRFSIQAEKQFNLMASDVGRPIRSIRHNFVFRKARAPVGSTEAPRPETDSPDDLEALLSEVIASVRERECEVQDKEGRWYSLRARPYFTVDNKVDGAVLVLVDITDLKSTEGEIKTARDHAEASAARLQDALSELEHFSYTITHDMRAPLRAMQGFAAMLLSESGNQLTAKSTDYLRRIMNAARRMDALIGDSLQYAKIIRERPPLTSTDSMSVLDGVLESYPTLQSPHAEIQVVKPLPPVIANEGGLAQCFSNLLANAVKFVKSGTVPRVRIWAETRGEIVRFWVEDKGIGIPQEYQERIFSMFQQLDKSYEGTGIGLALVRKTAARMGGKVGVESEPGKGSRFWLEFKKANPLIE